MTAPDDLLYTREHQWVRFEGAMGRVGITDFAQEALGDVVFVSLPVLGAVLERTALLGEVEATKAVSELYAPISGTVVEVNEALSSAPGQLNADPYGDGWICVIEPDGDTAPDDLLDAAAYQELTAS